jgi:hypothetical protein
VDLVDLVVSSRDATIVDTSGMGITAMGFLPTLSEGEGREGEAALVRWAVALAVQLQGLPASGSTLNVKPNLNDSSLTDGPRTTVVHK